VIRGALLLLVLTGASALDLAQLRQTQSTTSSLRLPFVQERHLILFDEPLRDEGVVELDRAQRSLRWGFGSGTVLILRDGHVRRWGPDGRPEDLPGDGGPLAGQMQALLDGDWRGLEAAFVLTPAATAPELRLTPRETAVQRYVSAITLRFRDDLTAPLELLLENPAGERTHYRFAIPEAVAIPAARFAGP
jgi:hypothetical protein